MKKAQSGDMVSKLKAAAQKGDTSRKMGLNFDKKSFDSLPKLPMKKAKFGKKMQYGGDAASMVPTMKKGGTKKKYEHGGTVSMQLGSYTRQIGKNYTGKNVVNKGAKAKMGKSVGKCKNGC